MMAVALGLSSCEFEVYEPENVPLKSTYMTGPIGGDVEEGSLVFSAEDLIDEVYTNVAVSGSYSNKAFVSTSTSDDAILTAIINDGISSNEDFVLYFSMEAEFTQSEKSTAIFFNQIFFWADSYTSKDYYEVQVEDSEWVTLEYGKRYKLSRYNGLLTISDNLGNTVFSIESYFTIEFCSIYHSTGLTLQVETELYKSRN